MLGTSSIVKNYFIKWRGCVSKINLQKKKILNAEEENHFWSYVKLIVCVHFACISGSIIIINFIAYIY